MRLINNAASVFSRDAATGACAGGVLREVGVGAKLGEERVGGDKEHANPTLGNGRKRGIDLAFVAGVDHAAGLTMRAKAENRGHTLT